MDTSPQIKPTLTDIETMRAVYHNIEAHADVCRELSATSRTFTERSRWDRDAARYEIAGSYTWSAICQLEITSGVSGQATGGPISIAEELARR